MVQNIMQRFSLDGCRELASDSTLLVNLMVTGIDTPG